MLEGFIYGEVRLMWAAFGGGGGVGDWGEGAFLERAKRVGSQRSCDHTHLGRGQSL